MQKNIESFQFVGSTTPNRRVCIVERHPISYVAPVTSILELCYSARCGNQTHASLHIGSVMCAFNYTNLAYLLVERRRFELLRMPACKAGADHLSRRPKLEITLQLIVLF